MLMTHLLPYPACPVLAGTYPMGAAHPVIARPPHTVPLVAFAIGQNPVTNAHYIQFIGADGYKRRELWTEAGWRWQEHKQAEMPPYLVDPQFNKPDQPVVGVSWYEAAAFARWLALETGLPWRLPAEAEWEAAARGADDEPQRPRKYNTAEWGLGRPWSTRVETNVSWCGARDLLGNVWEWCNTRWGHNWQTLEYPYPYHGGDGREDEEGSHARLMRGGSWFDPLTAADPVNRARYLPGSRGSNIGFRLAYFM